MRALSFRAQDLRLRHLAIGVSGFLVILLAIGLLTRTPPSQTPYLTIAGSGFMFNYRIGEVSYGFTAIVNKPVRNHSRIEAMFEDPQGGPPLHVTEKLTPRTTRYGVQSPPIRGVEKAVPYTVSVKLIRNLDDTVLFEDEFTVTSHMSDAVVPPEPLTIGPGYTRNPNLPHGWKRKDPGAKER